MINAFGGFILGFFLVFLLIAIADDKQLNYCASKNNVYECVKVVEYVAKKVSEE